LVFFAKLFLLRTLKPLTSPKVFILLYWDIRHWADMLATGLVLFNRSVYTSAGRSVFI